MLDLALLPCSLSLLLLQKLADEAVLTPQKFMEGAIEDETAFFEHEEGGVGVGLAVGEGTMQPCSVRIGACRE